MALPSPLALTQVTPPCSSYVFARHLSLPTPPRPSPQCTPTLTVQHFRFTVDPPKSHPWLPTAYGIVSQLHGLPLWLHLVLLSLTCF